jgi:hypothetical protein
MTLVMAVRRDEFHAVVRRVPFLALPREEIDRLHAGIEVVAIDDETMRRSSEFFALQSDIAVHHNYSWLTFRRPNNERTLLISTPLAANGPPPLFLGEELIVSVQRQIEERLALNGGYDVRLAGILQEVEGQESPPRVGLLSIARLAGRLSRDGAEYFGNMELRTARSQFDASTE